MTRTFVVAAALSLAAMAAASAQTQPAPVYDQSNSFGLSSAGVAPGPYIKGEGGYSASDSSRFGDSPVFGGGVGWRFSPWFRSDATFDYRSDGKDNVAGGARFTNWSAMLNAYIDLNLPFLRPLIPYVGAGAGIDQNKVGGSTVNAPGGTVAHLTGSNKNQFAWQAMAGVSWYLTPRLAVDVAYRYFYGGRAESGVATGLPVRGDYGAHEIIGGLRFGF